MDLLSTQWLSEMEMNDSAVSHQWQHMSSLENESFDLKPFPSTNNISAYDYTHNNNNYIPQLNHNNYASSNNSSSNSSTIISFGNKSGRVEKKKSSPSSSSSLVHREIYNMEDVFAPLEYGEIKKGGGRTQEQAQDHVLAERKRRENMTQKFVALSTLIPGLKKLDKATVLGDAINYIKELQERVKELEVEVKGNNNEEAITIRATKRPRLISSYDNEASSCGETIDGNCINGVAFGESSDNEISPEIEVRISEGKVMVRVYCKHQIGVIKEVMGDIEKHNLLMISSSVMPFGLNSLHMTIIAQMDAKSELTPKNLADNLRRSILNLV